MVAVTGSRGSEGGFELLEQGSGNMAQRKGPQAQRARVRSRVAPQDPGSESLAAVSRERDELRAQLDAARAEIERLRQVHTQVLDRIDWIVDSLNTLSEDEP